MAKAKKAASAVIDFVAPKKSSGALPSVPSVMTRSGISDLANAIKNREGQYGVRRVERAADEIPNLESLYTPQALADAFSGDNARALMTMNPADFERYAAPIGDSFKLDIYQPEQGRRLQARGEGLLPPITGDEYIKHLAQIKQQGGFSDIPYLNVNKEEQGLPDYPFISGHEGRHRNRAMAASGEQAGLVQFLPRAELREPFPRRMSEQYIDAIRKEMGLSGNFVLPQKYHIPSDTSINDVMVNRPAIELPDLYAQGGLIDSAPEEAIKNTITDPQAFRMLDMDLANLALMSQQQPRRMAGGGAMKKIVKATGRNFKNLVQREAPEQYEPIADAMRQSAQTGLEHSVVGNTNSGGESFVTRGTKDSVEPNKSDTRIALGAAGNPNIIDFHTHPANLTTFGVDPSPKDLAAYSDVYRRMAKERELRTLIAIPPERVEFLSKNITRPRTAYNFFATNDPSVLSTKTLDDMRYELQRAGGRGTFDAVRSDPRFKEYFENAGGNMGDTLGDAASLLMQRYRALQGKGRHELQLSGAPIDSEGAVTNSALFDSMIDPAMQVLEGKKFAQGGVIRMNDGGAFNPQGADYDYQTARAYGMGQDGGNWGSVAPASEGERKLHGLPEDSYLMLKGSQHPTWGKAVEAEESRGSKIVKYGDRYYSVPSKAEGGAVQRFDEGGQASQDQMRYELDRANSPVMQATPRGAIQDAIGTFGGYMDRAGKFVSEAIAPTAEKHPVKHFLADMILAAPLKGAGTLMQDLTGTVRETDEDNPVRGVISKDFRNLTTSRDPMLDPRVLDIAQFATPVVRGATKLVGAGAKAIEPFATRVDDMVRELYTSGAMPQPGLSIKDVTPKALAPANEQGFYSPTEAAALNLQRKTGNGQAFLNDIMKGENVSSEEISGMGLDTFLKDKKNVTAAEVQDYIAQNKLGLGESSYGTAPKLTPDEKTRLTYLDEENRKSPLGAIDDRLGEGTYTELMRLENIRDRSSVDSLYDQAKQTERRAQQMQRQGMQTAARALFTQANHFNARAEALDLKGAGIPKPTKFQGYSLPGGENYREVVLTLPQAPEHSEFARLNKKMNDDDGLLPDEMNRWTELGSKLGEEGRRQAREGKFKTAHWDETNPIAHLRMSDRVTDGKKTLLVDEVQSDWHQAGREQGYKDPSIDARLAKSAEEMKKNGDQIRDISSRMTALTDSDLDEFNRLADQRQKLYDRQGFLTEEGNALIDQRSSGVPDAPYKDDWYQLALRRAVKEAIDGGYDRVALPTGDRVNERFSLTKYIDRIAHKKNADGTYSLAAVDKEGRTALNDKSVPQDKLAGIVGKEVAQKIIDAEGKGYPKGSVSEDMLILSGLDLKVGGEGNRKYYDEIYPGYLKKFGKKYGATVGKTTTPTEYARDAQGIPSRYPIEEPLHYMEITPAMRKEFSTGIHMKRGGKVSFASNVDAMRHELNKRQ